MLELTLEELDQHMNKIKTLTHDELARIWRFASSEHPYLQNRNLFLLFKKRFDNFGGMTVSMSKKLDWGLN